MSARSQLIRGSTLRTINLVLSVVISFFMMPYLIHRLGDQAYGIWVVAGTLIGYYGLFDFGLSSAVTRFISRAVGDEQHLEIKEITSTAFYIFAAIGSVIMAVTFGLLPLAPVFMKTHENVTLFRWVLVLIASDIAVGMPIKVFSGAMIGRLRYDVSTALAILRTVLASALIIFAVHNGYGLLGMAAAHFSTSVIVYSLETYSAYRLVPGLTVSRVYFRREKVRSLFGYSVFTFFTQVADVLRFKIDAVVIAAYLGASSVTVYFIAGRLVEYFIQFVTNIMGVLTPVFSRYEGLKDFESIKEKFFLTTKISTVCSVLFGGMVVLFGKPFIARWMGPTYMEAYPLLLILVIPTMFALMQVPSINLLYGISKHNFYTYSNSAEGILNLVLSIILVRHMGLVGVAVGTAIPMLITKFFVQPVYVCKVVGIDFRQYLFTVGKSFLYSGVALAVPWLLLKGLLITTYSRIMLVGSLNAAVYVMAVLWFVFNESELESIHPAMLRLRP